MAIKNRDGSENSNEWETPDWLYVALDAVFEFDKDPCPIKYQYDGLAETTKWGTSNYINPPYDRYNKPRFIKRAFKEWQNGATCVLLIPAAVDTKQFHSLLFPGAVVMTWKQWKTLKEHTYEKAIVLFEGRISFKGFNTKGEYVTDKKGKHASMLVILNNTL